TLQTLTRHSWAAGTARVSAPSPEPPTIRFVDVDGLRLRTSVRGSGRPLLSASTWPPLRARTDRTGGAGDQLRRPRHRAVRCLRMATTHVRAGADRRVHARRPRVRAGRRARRLPRRGAGPAAG